MPVSQKPRMKKREATGPAPYTLAGTLFYGFYEQAALRKAAGPSMEDMFRRQRTGMPRTRRDLSGRTYHPCAGAESREAKRRARQGVHHAQHPTVVARFGELDARAREAKEAIARVEGVDRSMKSRIGAVAGKLLGRKGAA
ncbi:hypothetical protein [Methylobacterium aquaticum]|nr:hypothetical protein [Methylobacterium aquaticum]